MNKVIYGRAAPINYIDLPFSERWCIGEIIGGSWIGEYCCLICTFQDKSVVEISPDGCDNTVIDIIDNKDLSFNFAEHLETNRLLEEMNR